MRIESLWINPLKRRSCHGDDDIAFLSAVPFFDLLSFRHKKKVYNLLHQRTFSEGEIVFRKGDPGLGMYIIRDGGVSIYNEFSDFSRVKIADLSSGDFFGEISLLNDSPRSATVLSTGNTVLFGLFRHDLLDLMNSDPSLSVKLVYRLSQIVAARLRIFNDIEEN